MSTQTIIQQNLYIDSEAAEITDNFEKLSLNKCEPFVISGCSGAGKGTLVKYLLNKFPELFELSVSYTTRQPRAGQKHGREYFFVSRDEFLSEADKNGFVEWGEIYGNYYATHKGEVQRIMKKGKICILEIDLKAAQKIYAANPDYHYLFIDVPEFEVLRKRMIKRGTENQETIQKRMSHSRKQLDKIKQLEFYDHIVNEELEKTKVDLIDFINKRYQKNLIP